MARMERKRKGGVAPFPTFAWPSQNALTIARMLTTGADFRKVGLPQRPGEGRGVMGPGFRRDDRSTMSGENAEAYSCN